MAFSLVYFRTHAVLVRDLRIQWFRSYLGSDDWWSWRSPWSSSRSSRSSHHHISSHHYPTTNHQYNALMVWYRALTRVIHLHMLGHASGQIGHDRTWGTSHRTWYITECVHAHVHVHILLITHNYGHLRTLMYVFIPIYWRIWLMPCLGLIYQWFRTCAISTLDVRTSRITTSSLNHCFIRFGTFGLFWPFWALLDRFWTPNVRSG